MDPRPPFEAAYEDGILTLTLDTPFSTINVFSVAAAEQLLALLADVRPERTRAVVLESGKPGSFVNGVGLMLANAVKTEADAARLTGPVREAYARLRTLPVPTIALIRGTCFGCGVELALCCTHRIAIDDPDTELYMTEIADYLFVPAFGGTYALPRLLGLRRATDLLLWGERWDARAAHAHGLADLRVSHAQRRHAVASVLDRSASSRRASRGEDDARDEGFLRDTRARIARLPTGYREVYTTCFELMRRVASGERDEQTARAEELEACGKSAMTPISKAAQGFFFVRQIADQRARHGARPTGDVVLDDVPALAALVAPRPGVRVAHGEDHATDVGTTPGPFVIGPLGGARRADARVLVSATKTEDTAPRVHVRKLGRTPPFVEVSGAGEDAATTYAALTRLGLRAVRTAGPTSLVDDALDALGAAHDRCGEAGLEPRGAARALSDFGLDALPRGPLSHHVGPGIAIVSATSFHEATPEPRVVPAVLLALLAFARDALASGAAPHVSTVDVLAREALGFPLGEGSLCRHLGVARVVIYLAAASDTPALYTDAVRTSARTYVEGGRDFYR